jgi:hypothetical protein
MARGREDKSFGIAKEDRPMTAKCRKVSYIVSIKYQDACGDTSRRIGIESNEIYVLFISCGT